MSDLVQLGGGARPGADRDAPTAAGAAGVAGAAAGLGWLVFFLMLWPPAASWRAERPWLCLAASLGLIAVGSAGAYYLGTRRTTPGIQHNGLFFSSALARGAQGYALGLVLTAFYVLLYWFPAPLAPWIELVAPLSWTLRAAPPDRWFLYGSLYTLAVVVMGVRMAMKYRHNRYQLVRTASVMFFQFGFAWLLPGWLRRWNEPEHYFSYFWPLKPEYLYPAQVQGWVDRGGWSWVMLAAGILGSFVLTPVLTHYYGKRWYCSWVCGCGGLAETLGDPWRQLSSKSTWAWRLERVTIHSVLVLVVATTALLWAQSVYGGEGLRLAAGGFKRWYGFFIGALFSGVVGVGFYPILGSRVWCRFGCPMAAILGLIQRFYSRFRITTNGGQCISCGNCSTYCEMGIDVRAYAQRGDHVVRASCVGCGVCAAVCPRGVLKLESGPVGDRFRNSDRPLRALGDALRGRSEGE